VIQLENWKVEKMIEAAAGADGFAWLRESRNRKAGKVSWAFRRALCGQLLNSVRSPRTEAAFELGSLLKSISNLQKNRLLQARPKNDTQPADRDEARRHRNVWISRTAAAFELPPPE